jgi:hypothetical protein
VKLAGTQILHQMVLGLLSKVLLRLFVAMLLMLLSNVCIFTCYVFSTVFDNSTAASISRAIVFPVFTKICIVGTMVGSRVGMGESTEDDDDNKIANFEGIYAARSEMA